MGVFGQLKNKKKTEKQRKAMKWKRQKRAEMKKNTQTEVIIEDAQLLSKDMLKNKLKNKKNNIKISNKKRNRLLKRLRYQHREKEQVDEDGM
nr:hypothetical protein BaRGS_020738 [Batillaria attramentaria]